MTNREKEALRKVYQRKCINEKIAIEKGVLEAIQSCEDERVGVLQACMAIIEVNKREGSSRPLIDEWEAEVGFDEDMLPLCIH